MIDLPPSLPQDVVRCISVASSHYGVDPRITIDRIVRRAGKNGEARDVNGSIELGLYGVPERGLATLTGFKVTSDQIRTDDCLNVSVGVYLEWRARNAIAAGATAGPARPASASVQAQAGQSRGRSLPKLDDRAQACVDAAAVAYQIPGTVFRAVLRTEGGWVGLKKRNSNGSYDMGPAQINTIHLPELAKSGITEAMLVGDACVNVYVAAYRLRVEIERAGDFWRGVGNYHSRTPTYHQRYLQRVMKNL